MESKEPTSNLSARRRTSGKRTTRSTPIVSHKFGPKDQASPTNKATSNSHESNRGATKVRLPGAMTKANFGSSAPTGQASTREQNDSSQPPPSKASTTTHQAARPRHPETGPTPPATQRPHTHAPHPQPRPPQPTTHTTPPRTPTIPNHTRSRRKPSGNPKEHCTGRTRLCQDVPFSPPPSITRHGVCVNRRLTVLPKQVQRWHRCYSPSPGDRKWEKLKRKRKKISTQAAKAQRRPPRAPAGRLRPQPEPPQSHTVCAPAHKHRTDHSPNAPYGPTRWERPAAVWECGNPCPRTPTPLLAASTENPTEDNDDSGGCSQQDTTERSSTQGPCPTRAGVRQESARDRGQARNTQQAP